MYERSNNYSAKINDYTTTIKVDKSVKKFEVEFNSNSTKVTKVIVELKEDNK